MLFEETLYHFYVVMFSVYIHHVCYTIPSQMQCFQILVKIFYLYFLLLKVLEIKDS